jgi:glycosyltransferase involved in cell wall biosynthesis
VNAPAASPKKILFFANGIFSGQISGGDIHFFHLAQAAMDAGYTVHFFGGHALEKQLRARFKHFELTLTDGSPTKPFNANSFFGQFQLLFDYSRRSFGSLWQLSKIQPHDTAYAVSDYWFDVWPLLLCRAGSKIMIWHMQAPSLGQIISRSRPDVDASRVAALYYWLSQNLSLRLFQFCRNKLVLLVHPAMRGRLLALAYHPEGLTDISFGLDAEKAAAARGQNKIYDAVWIGRVHRQKGIEDLLATLSHLAKQIENFRAVLIGDLRAELQPQIEQRGLSRSVEFSGFVSEEEKFRLFHASRVFLMTSRFEGSPRVVAEALACEVPVVAYDVETYHPLFGDLLRYVPCFDLDKFQGEARRQINEMRAGRNYLSGLDLVRFSEVHSWHATGRVFLQAVEQLRAAQKNLDDEKH